MDAYNALPEVKTQREKMTQESDKLETATNQKILSVLTKNQRANFNKMKGPDFNLALLNTQNNGNGPGGPGTGNAAGTTNGAATTGAATTGTTKPGTAKPGTAKAKTGTTPKKTTTKTGTTTSAAPRRGFVWFD